MAKYVYLLHADGYEDMVFEHYRDACNKAKRAAMEEYNCKLFADRKKRMNVTRTQVSVGVLDPKGGWYYPYVGKIKKYILN